MRVGSSWFSNNFKYFVNQQYQQNIIYSTSSIEIKDKSLNSKRIREALTDFIGNFLSSLYSTLPKYNDVEKKIKIEFTSHKFKPEKKQKQKNFNNFK